MIKPRGIILTPDVTIHVENNSILLHSGQPNPSLLRHAILYWDKIDFPQNNIIQAHSQDIDFLEQEGIAQKTQVRIQDSGEMATLYVYAQLAAFEQLNRQNQGMWTMGQHAKKFINPFADKANTQSIEIEINSVLPAPPDNISLADILEFKQKRKDEFTTLRIAVDQLYDDALKWEQIPRGENAAIQHLQEVIKDIQKIVDSSWLPLKSSVKFDFSLPNIIGGSIAGSSFALSFGLDDLVYVGAAIGAVAAPIKIESKIISTPLEHLPEGSRNFAALYYLEKEFPGSLKQQHP